MKTRALAAGTTETRPTRDLILDAAERRFAGVSVREIAADVGLKNQASLYHHFRHKRAIYEAVLTRGVEAMVALVATSVGGSGTDLAGDLSRMEATLDRVVDYLVEHPHL